MLAASADLLPFPPTMSQGCHDLVANLRSLLGKWAFFFLMDKPDIVNLKNLLTPGGPVLFKSNYTPLLTWKSPQMWQLFQVKPQGDKCKQYLTSLPQTNGVRKFFPQAACKAVVTSSPAVLCLLRRQILLKEINEYLQTWYLQLYWNLIL